MIDLLTGFHTEAETLAALEQMGVIASAPTHPPEPQTIPAVPEQPFHTFDGWLA